MGKKVHEDVDFFSFCHMYWLKFALCRTMTAFMENDSTGPNLGGQNMPWDESDVVTGWPFFSKTF